MTCVEHVHLCLRHVFAMAFRLSRIERQIVLAADHQQSGLFLLQPCLSASGTATGRTRKSFTAPSTTSPPGASSSGRRDCLSAAPRRNYRRALGRPEAECQGPAAGARRCQAANLYRLPPSHMRTIVHVQHLPGHVTGFRQINNSVGDVLRSGNRTHR